MLIQIYSYFLILYDGRVEVAGFFKNWWFYWFINAKVHNDVTIKAETWKILIIQEVNIMDFHLNIFACVLTW